MNNNNCSISLPNGCSFLAPRAVSQVILCYLMNPFIRMTIPALCLSFSCLLIRFCVAGLRPTSVFVVQRPAISFYNCKQFLSTFRCVLSCFVGQIDDKMANLASIIFSSGNIFLVWKATAALWLRVCG